MRSSNKAVLHLSAWFSLSRFFKVGVGTFFLVRVQHPSALLGTLKSQPKPPKTYRLSARP